MLLVPFNRLQVIGILTRPSIAQPVQSDTRNLLLLDPTANRLQVTDIPTRLSTAQLVQYTTRDLLLLVTTNVNNLQDPGITTTTRYSLAQLVLSAPTTTHAMLAQQK